MFLKELTVQGFKSFAGPVRLVLGSGITAIVGPNGTGKSNLVDALRWALGEQNLRALRLRHLEDLIFSGSAQRPRLGMAQVTLLLDNSDEALPLPLAEVAITRRAYRSGESELLLNQRRIRLRDLQELLQAAGFGVRPYSFISQGMVDLFLTLRPEERRALIEDAAGVRQARLELETAQERRRAAQENLQRLELLTSELAPRLRQTERRARRAQEHQQLSQRLGAALQHWHRRQWRTAQGALVAARAEAAAASQEEETLRPPLASLEEALREGETALAALQSAHRAAAHEEAQLAAEDQALAHRAELERQQVQERAREQQLLQGDEASLAEEIALFEANLTELEKRGRQLATNEPSLAQRALAIAQERESLLGQQAAVHERLRSLEEEHLQALRQLLEAETRREQLAVEERRLREEASRDAQQRQSLVLPAMEARRSLQALRAERRALEAALAATRLGRAEGEGRLLQLQRGLQQAEEALQQRQQRLVALEMELRELEFLLLQAPTVEDLRAIAGALDLSPERLTTLVQALRVREGFEAAVEAALEGCLHGILVPHPPSWARALDLLRQRSYRRALIPWDMVPRSSPVLPAEPGVIGWASSFVDSSPPYQPVVQALLGSVLVVEDWAVLERCALLFSGAIVTRAGECWSPPGIVRGGPSPTAVGESTFHRSQRLQRLAAEEQRLGADLSAQRLRVVQDRQQQEALSSALAALPQEEAQQMQHLQTLAVREIGQQREIERWLRQGRALRSRQRERARGLEEIASQQRRTEEALEALRPGAASLQAPLEQAREELLRLREQEAALSRTAAELSALQESGAREAQALHAQEGLAESSLRRLHARREELRQRRQVGGQALSEARQQVAEMEARAQALQLRRKEVADRRQALDSEMEALGARLASGREEQTKLRQSYDLTAQRRAGAGAEIVRWERELHHLQELRAADGLPPPDSDLRDLPILEEVAGGLDPERLRAQLRALGPADPETLQEYQELRERWDALTAQQEDLQQTGAQLQEAMAELRARIRQRFQATFHAVDAAFRDYFSCLFSGGRGQLMLTEGEEDPGVELVVQLPGKRAQGAAALSGGERALVAMALLFALLRATPAPFCVLDEVDAALDDSNVGRFLETLRELAEQTQFLIVTHNRGTMEVADGLYGITTAGDGQAGIYSLHLSSLADNRPIESHK